MSMAYRRAFYYQAGKQVISHAQPLDEAYILSLLGRPQCRQRNIIERMFGWLKFKTVSLRDSTNSRKVMQ